MDDKRLIPRLDYNKSRIPETDPRGSEGDFGSLETELRAHRTHDTFETGLQSVLRSLVAPHKEGPADPGKRACDAPVLC